jgi:hypothetical protein
MADDSVTITVNGDAVGSNVTGLNEMIEITQGGTFVTQKQLDSGNGGALFGIAITYDNLGVYFVDDNDNTLHQLTPP